MAADTLLGATAVRPDSMVLLNEWDLFMAAQDYSERTREMYGYTMLRLMRRNPGCHVLDLGESAVVAFLASLGSHAHSKQLYMRGLRSFYGWVHARGWVEPDPTALLKPKHPHRSRPQPYTEDELVRLVIAAAWRNPRHAWAILACYALGTRRGEFCYIVPGDIDWEHSRVELRVTKGRKPRWVDMGPLAAEAIHELLPGANGTLLGIKPQTFTEWVNRAASDAGFPPGRKRRAHTLRSTFATTLERSGVRPSVIQELLGHESLSTTTLYLGVFDGETAQAVQTL